MPDRAPSGAEIASDHAPSRVKIASDHDPPRAKIVSDSVPLHCPSPCPWVLHKCSLSMRDRCRDRVPTRSFSRLSSQNTA